MRPYSAVVAFTGHRPQHLTPAQIKQAQIDIESVVATLTADDLVISGMALGVDQWAARFAVEQGVPFAAYVPFVGQHMRWSEEETEDYNYLLSKAVEVVVVCPGGYAAWKFQKRNEAMVDVSDALSAHFIPGKSGGTMNCMKYAAKVGKTVLPHPL